MVPGPVQCKANFSISVTTGRKDLPFLFLFFWGFFQWKVPQYFQSESESLYSWRSVSQSVSQSFSPSLRGAPAETHDQILVAVNTAAVLFVVEDLRCLHPPSFSVLPSSPLRCTKIAFTSRFPLEGTHFISCLAYHTNEVSHSKTTWLTYSLKPPPFLS
jgi:hypothetical protein